MTVENGSEDNTASGRWRATIDNLVAGLADHLGEPVTVIDAEEMEDAFSCLIRGPEPTGPSLQVAWKGVLGMQFIDEQPDISVSMFLFSRGRRLRLDDEPGSYLEIVYEGPADGSGTWRDLGWLQDDFGEFAAYDRYGD
ncbi:hypothetical protein [Nocardia carnea]|uniref:hypothetical protein n=1 Tax=Nocardia carnea TaxID=37328 RepID=UPI002454AD0B|nr:hypothetical protein [Nocardia carnea]